MSGFICVNKEVGVSSAREVARIKRFCGIPCGHMGTLDPLASGVLPIAVGNATRLFDYFLKKEKTYVATFRFGAAYDTLDITGNVTQSGGRIPAEEEILAVIPRLVGEVMQVPPNYSAKSVGGKRGYALARQGVEFTLPPKKVYIKSIYLKEKVGSDSFTFEIECGSGTYIRSIARDMAACLGTYACMSGLIRTKSGIFTIDNSVKTSELSEENIKNYIIPCEDVLPFDSIYPMVGEAKKLFCGLSLPCGYADGQYKIFNENKEFYGIAAVSEGILKVRTKLC